MLNVQTYFDIWIPSPNACLLRAHHALLRQVHVFI